MEIPLPLLLEGDPALLEQVVLDVPPDGVALEVEVDVHVLAEARGVVVAVGLCVAEGLEDGVGLQEDVLDPLDLALPRHVGHRSDVPHDDLGGLRLAGTRLACKKFLNKLGCRVQEGQKS